MRTRVASLIGFLALAGATGCGGGDEPAAPPAPPPVTTATAEAPVPPAAPATTPTTPSAPTPDLPGLPAGEAGLIAGYAGWTELTTAPIAELRSLGAGAHRGAKRIWASPTSGVGPDVQVFPYRRGSVVVKEARSGDAITLIAIMEKVRANDAATGGWRYAEYTRPDGGGDFTKVAFPESGCASCHMNANTRQKTDWVFFSR